MMLLLSFPSLFSYLSPALRNTEILSSLGAYGLCLCAPIQEIGKIAQGRFPLKSMMRKLSKFLSFAPAPSMSPGKALAMYLHGHMLCKSYTN